MKKRIINLGLSMAIISVSLVSYYPLVLASKNRLPKVGFIKSSEQRGEGCYYSLAGNKRKQYIFINASGTIMNFDGQDTNLVRVSGESKKLADVTNYTANHLKVRVITVSNNRQDFTVKGTITIKSGSDSKVVKFDGYCG